MLSSGKRKVSWKAGKVKGLTAQTYTVRYQTDSGAFEDMKCKTTSKTHVTIPQKAFLAQNGNRSLDNQIAQIRTNAKYKGKTLHSGWVSYMMGPAYRPASNQRVYCLDADHPGSSWENHQTDIMPQSVKLRAAGAGRVAVSWGEPKEAYPADKNRAGFIVRYSYNKSMKGVKELVSSRYTHERTLTGLKKGGTVYVQMAVGERSMGGYARCTRLTAVKAIKVPAR